jgi:type I restriction enzyme S subunit
MTPPQGWTRKRLKYWVTRRTEKATATSSSDYIGLENVESWTGRRLLTQSPPEAECTVFQAGDVLFGKLRPYLAKVHAPSEAGVCTSEMLVLRPRPAVSQNFLSYLLASADFIDQVNATTFGAKMPRADWETISNFTISLPTVPSQRAITELLDRETAKIDNLIAKKQRLIGLLEEKRAACLSRAVTQGLDQNTATKDSGAEWLGQIPKTWQPYRIRHTLRKIEQGWSPQCDSRPADEDEWGVLKVGCVNGWRLDESENKALPPDLTPDPTLEIRSGDVLISRANTRELLGSAIAVGHVRSRLLLCDKLYRARPTKALVPKFLALLLRTASIRFQLEREATGASNSMQNVGQDTIRNIRFALPPIDEQHKIVLHIERQTSDIERTRAALEGTIDRLREYRAALITAAVTGQLDLRQHEKQMEAIA